MKHDFLKIKPFDDLVLIASGRCDMGLEIDGYLFPEYFYNLCGKTIAVDNWNGETGYYKGVLITLAMIQEE